MRGTRATPFNRVYMHSVFYCRRACDHTPPPRATNYYITRLDFCQALFSKKMHKIFSQISAFCTKIKMLQKCYKYYKTVTFHNKPKILYHTQPTFVKCFFQKFCTNRTPKICAICTTTFFQFCVDNKPEI